MVGVKFLYRFSFKIQQGLLHSMLFSYIGDNSYAFSFNGYTPLEIAKYTLNFADLKEPDKELIISKFNVCEEDYLSLDIIISRLVDFIDEKNLNKMVRYLVGMVEAKISKYTSSLVYSISNSVYKNACGKVAKNIVSISNYNNSTKFVDVLNGEVESQGISNSVFIDTNGGVKYLQKHIDDAVITDILSNSIVLISIDGSSDVVKACNITTIDNNNTTHIDRLKKENMDNNDDIEITNIKYRILDDVVEDVLKTKGKYVDDTKLIEVVNNTKIKGVEWEDGIIKTSKQNVDVLLESGKEKLKYVDAPTGNVVGKNKLNSVNIHDFVDKQNVKSTELFIDNFTNKLVGKQAEPLKHNDVSLNITKNIFIEGSESVKSTNTSLVDSTIGDLGKISNKSTQTDDDIENKQNKQLEVVTEVFNSDGESVEEVVEVNNQENVGVDQTIIIDSSTFLTTEKVSFKEVLSYVKDHLDNSIVDMGRYLVGSCVDNTNIEFLKRIAGNIEGSGIVEAVTEKLKGITNTPMELNSKPPIKNTDNNAEEIKSHKPTLADLGQTTEGEMLDLKSVENTSIDGHIKETKIANVLVEGHIPKDKIINPVVDGSIQREKLINTLVDTSNQKPNSVDIIADIRTEDVDSLDMGHRNWRFKTGKAHDNIWLNPEVTELTKKALVRKQLLDTLTKDITLWVREATGEVDYVYDALVEYLREYYQSNLDNEYKNILVDIVYKILTKIKPLKYDPEIMVIDDFKLRVLESVELVGEEYINNQITPYIEKKSLAVEAKISFKAMLDFVLFVEMLIESNRFFYAASRPKTAIDDLITKLEEWLTVSENVPVDYEYLLRWFKWWAGGSRDESDMRLIGYQTLINIKDKMVEYFESRWGERVIEYGDDNMYIYSKDKSYIDRIRGKKHGVAGRADRKTMREEYGISEGELPYSVEED